MSVSVTWGVAHGFCMAVFVLAAPDVAFVFGVGVPGFAAEGSSAVGAVDNFGEREGVRDVAGFVGVRHHMHDSSFLVIVWISCATPSINAT